MLVCVYAPYGIDESSGTCRLPGCSQKATPVIPISPPRNPFPEPLLLTIVLNLSGEQLASQAISEDGSGGGGNRAAEDDESSSGAGRDSAAEGSDSGGRGNNRAGRAEGRAPFVLLLKKATDLVLQPFQALQVCS